MLRNKGYCTHVYNSHQNQRTTAGDLVNSAAEKALADWIYQYGEERRARKIARAIVRARPIRSTLHLAGVVERAVPRTGFDPKYSISQNSGGELAIVKTSNGVAIPDDEPLILFRARDHNALAALRHYRAVCVNDRCTDYHMAGIDNRIQSFEDFSLKHADRMKQPGCTRGK